MGKNGQIFSESDRGHERESMKMLRMAVAKGWDLRGFEDLPGKLKTLVDDSKATPREKIAAYKLIVQMDRSNAKKLELMDRINRLDDGQPTDIHRHHTGLEDLTNEELLEEARKLAEQDRQADDDA